MKPLSGHLLLAVGASFWLAGCASVGPPLPPSLELPKAPSDLRAARKGDKVTLTWTVPQRTTDRQRVRYLGKTQICRTAAEMANECGIPVGEAAPDSASAKTGKKPTASFIDTLPSVLERENPKASATYAVEVLNTAGKGAGLSNQVRVPLVPTLPPFGDFLSQATAQGVLISWQCPIASETAAGIRYLFRIYRRGERDPKDVKLSDVDATACAQGAAGQAASTGPATSAQPVTSFLDQTFEWEKTYFYRGAVVSLIDSAGKPPTEVEGEDTPEVKVFAHDVYPPAVPSGLQAVFSGPGQKPFIDLIWAPVPDTELDGYNVYRHEAGGAGVKLNAEPVKTPAFRDAQVSSGKTYFYSVSAVDLRGNESARSEEASENVP